MARKQPTKGAPWLLRKWREAQGLTQQDACELVELDPATYNAFEAGRKRPGLKRARAIEVGTGGAVPMEAWIDGDAHDKAAA